MKKLPIFFLSMLCGVAQGLHRRSHSAPTDVIKYDNNDHTMDTVVDETIASILGGHVMYTRAAITTQRLTPTMATFNGLTPLHMAAASGNYEAAVLLIQKGWDFNAQNDCGLTPLHCAAYKGHAHIVYLLLKANANPNAQDTAGYTPLARAVEAGHNNIVRLLCAYNADKNIRTTSGQTLFDIACSSMAPDATILEIIVGTTLFKAVKTGNIELTRKFLAAGINPNAGKPLIYLAVCNNNIPMIILLHKYKADLNDTYKGSSALHVAIEKGNIPVVRLLCNLGANVELRNTHGHTPMHEAAAHGNCDMLTALIARKASVNVKNLKGSTPLMLAAQCNKTEAARLLCNNNADKLYTRPDGTNALYWANRNNNPILQDILTQP